MDDAELVGVAALFAASCFAGGALAVAAALRAGPARVFCGLLFVCVLLPGPNDRRYATTELTSVADATKGGMPPAFMVASGAWISFANCASERFAIKPAIAGTRAVPAPAGP